MVLPASNEIVDLLNPGANTIGIRIPDCLPSKNLFSKSGPLATTSANLSGSTPSLNEEDASSNFPGLPLLGPLPWGKPSGIASTVIRWESNANWSFLRKGSLIPLNIK